MTNQEFQELVEINKKLGGKYDNIVEQLAEDLEFAPEDKDPSNEQQLVYLVVDEIITYIRLITQKGKSTLATLDVSDEKTTPYYKVLRKKAKIEKKLKELNLSSDNGIKCYLVGYIDKDVTDDTHKTSLICY